MRLKSLLTKTTALLLAVGFCLSVHAQRPIKIIQGADTLITKNTLWDCDTIYFMKGKVYVTNSAELTIQPGTVIVGDTISKGTLLITKGSKIHATGTASCPIVFTSSKAPGKRNRGDWGGVILLGRATINVPGGTANIEGLAPSSLTEYGGGANPNDNDNSGELSFVRIEFAGVAFAPNNEINGLTMGGVGRGTKIDYVQVSYANDDSFEWFGGTVNCKHLIAFRGIDDDFDTDFGFSGKVQFAIGIRDPNVADISGSNGFESDNDANSSLNTPQTRAAFSNVTIVAGGDTTVSSNFRNAALIRRNSHEYIYNSILMGYPTGITIDGTTTNSNVQADTMVQNVIIAATQSAKWVVSTTANTTVTNLLLNNAANRFYTGNTFVGLYDPYNLNKPDVRPVPGSPALSGSSFKHIGLNDPFFVQTPYVGAVNQKSNQNWAQLWVNWKPSNTNYQVVCPCSAFAPGTSEAFLAAVAESEKAQTLVDLNVYPNPARGSFKVNLAGFNGAVNIKVVNMSGATVYSNQAVASAKYAADVTLNKAVPGLYFVTVSDGKTSVTKKINIIQ